MCSESRVHPYLYSEDSYQRQDHGKRGGWQEHVIPAPGRWRQELSCSRSSLASEEVDIQLEDVSKTSIKPPQKNPTISEQEVSFFDRKGN